MRNDSVLNLPVDQIVRDPTQPRKTFPKGSLQELADSILLHGLIHPIEVVPLPDGRYMIREGERRWRAHKLAKIATIPAIVNATDYSQVEKGARQYVENVEREDMNVIDEAEFFAHMLSLPAPDGSKMTAIKLSRMLGMKGQVTTINNRLVWLRLEKEIQELARHGKLLKSERVPKALLKVPNAKTRIQLAHQFASRGASIPAIEAACGNVVKRLEKAAAQRQNGLPPMVNLAAPESQLPDPDKTFALNDIRDYANRSCAACTLRDLVPVREPAWHLVMEHANQTCQTCPIEDLQICRECPCVTFVGLLVKAGLND